MRREFIIVLLIAISISIISSLISSNVPPVGDKILLDTVAGTVGAGNFSYWHSGHVGPLLIELISLNGDADLYISDHISPSYEFDQNNFSSVTCGLDVVSIPMEFPRPLGIGVFGDWSHTRSEYSLHVYLDTIAVMRFTEERLLMAEQQNYSPPSSSEKTDDNDQKIREKVVPKKMDEEKPRFLKLINILDMIFEMFVL